MSLEDPSWYRRLLEALIERQLRRYLNETMRWTGRLKEKRRKKTLQKDTQVGGSRMGSVGLGLLKDRLSALDGRRSV